MFFGANTRERAIAEDAGARHFVAETPVAQKDRAPATRGEAQVRVLPGTSSVDIKRLRCSVRKNDSLTQVPNLGGQSG